MSLFCHTWNPAANILQLPLENPVPQFRSTSPPRQFQHSERHSLTHRELPSIFPHVQESACHLFASNTARPLIYTSKSRSCTPPPTLSSCSRRICLSALLLRNQKFRVLVDTRQQTNTHSPSNSLCDTSLVDGSETGFTGVQNPPHAGDVVTKQVEVLMICQHSFPYG